MFGITQPNRGMFLSIVLADMPKRSKRLAPEPLLRLRAALASNLRAYIAVKYGRGVTETAAAADIGEATGLGKNTVLRALGKGGDEVDIRLDTLVRLALHFGAEANDLLHDYGRANVSAMRGTSRTNQKENNNKARAEGKDSDAPAELRRNRRV